MGGINILQISARNRNRNAIDPTMIGSRKLKRPQEKMGARVSKVSGQRPLPKLPQEIVNMINDFSYKATAKDVYQPWNQEIKKVNIPEFMTMAFDQPSTTLTYDSRKLNGTQVENGKKIPKEFEVSVITNPGGSKPNYVAYGRSGSDSLYRSQQLRETTSPW